MFLYDKPSSLCNELDVNIQKYFPEFEIHSPQVVTIADEYNLGSTMLLAALLMLMALETFLICIDTSFSGVSTIMQF